MASASVGKAGALGVGATLVDAVSRVGTAGHSYVGSDALLRGSDSARSLADAVHFLCTLHGRHPGILDHAADRTADPGAHAWLAASLDAFAAERHFLTRLAVAAGPVPSTPGAGDSDAVLIAQHHAIEMLGQSERKGCALGSALGLVGDWSAIRQVLDVAAQRFGVDVPVRALGSPDSLAPIAEAAASSPALERAIAFGAEQLLLQHSGLWDLLEARHEARAG